MKNVNRLLLILASLFAITTISSAQGSDWTLNPNDYQYDMAVYAGLMIDEKAVSDYTNYEVAAFVNEECRGVANVDKKDGKSWLYIRVRSNTVSGETVMFKLYDKQKGLSFDLDESIPFQSNGLVGMPSAPKMLSLKKYTVSFIIDGKINEERMTIGNVIPKPADPTKEGHTFTGWEPEFVEGATVPVGGITYTAQWQVNQYTLKFDSDGGSSIAPITQDYGSEIQTPEPPVKEGHTFTGWEPEIPATMPAKDMTFKAGWQINQYEVNFIVDGVDNKVSQNYGTVISTPEDPVKEGYTFTGWEPEFVEGTTVPVGGVTYTAQWQVNQYTLTFDSNGGSGIAPLTQDYGSEIQTPEPPVKEGHTFTGWEPEIPATMPAKDMTFKAGWQINQYEVIFIVDGNEIKMTQDYGSVIVPPEDPTKEGTTFEGWIPEFIEGTTVPEGGITYTAKWSTNQYVITFDSDGGTNVLPIVQDYGTPITAPEDPTKEGYTFLGWNPELPTTMPAEDMTLKAQWQVNQYEVVFIVDSVENKTIQDYGTVITAPEDPVKEGHTFTGWNPDFEEGITVPVGGITYTAQWQVNQYTLKFDSDGGSSIAPITQDYGSEIQTPESPVKEGHTFTGWEPEIPATMPAKDLIVKAQWMVNQYTLTFDTNGGTEIAPITQDYGTEITIPEDPTREYYTFIGWSEEIPTTMPATDVTVMAQWEVNMSLVKSDFTRFLEGVIVVDEEATADEIIRQPVPYSHEEILEAYKTASEMISIADGEALLTAFYAAQESLGAYKEYCERNGNPISYVYAVTEEWGTLILPFDFNSPQDWTFYQVNAIAEDGNTLSLEETTDIAVFTPYIIKGTTGKKIQFIGHLPNQVSNVTQGLLTGVLTEDYTPEIGVYVLQTLNGKKGFYRVNDAAGSPLVSVMHCYLQVPESSAEVPVFYLDNGENGINGIFADKKVKTQIFNLAGQRQYQVSRGINIVNGKKILVK